METKLTITTLSFSFFLVLLILSYFASYVFVDTFRTKLRTKEKVFWCLAFVRAMFGFCATAVGLWFLIMDDSLHKDVASATNVTSYMATYSTFGFFIFECTALLTSNIYFQYFDSFLFIHHFLSLIGFIIVTTYNGKGHFFVAVGLLLEGTTPFSCFCWMLLKCKMAHLHIWRLNQLILVHLFHCRTTLEGYLFLKYFSQWDNVSVNMPLAASTLLLTQLTLQFFVLTPYWTYKKMYQLFNPVDWNHPELSSSRVIANGTVNAAHNGHTQTHRRRPRRSKQD